MAVPSLLGSLELMGNPTNLLRNVGRGFFDLILLPMEGIMSGHPYHILTGLGQGVSSLLRHSSQGTLMTVSGLSSSLARNLEKLSWDPGHQASRQQQRSQAVTLSDGAGMGFLRGVRGLSFGVFSGLTGIVSQPVVGVYRHGLEGLWGGVSRGLLGAVVKPIGGAFELVSYTSQGLLRSVSGGQGEGVFRRTREPQALLPVDHPVCVGEFVRQLQALQKARQGLGVEAVPLPAQCAVGYSSQWLCLQLNHNESLSQQQQQQSLVAKGAESALRSPVLFCCGCIAVLDELVLGNAAKGAPEAAQESRSGGEVKPYGHTLLVTESGVCLLVRGAANCSRLFWRFSELRSIRTRKAVVVLTIKVVLALQPQPLYVDVTVTPQTNHIPQLVMLLQQLHRKRASFK
jgi:hypothetical protein